MSWFPITDLSRAQDIARRRRRALLLLGGIVLSAVVLLDGKDRTPVVLHAWHPGSGVLREIAATSLRIDLPCAGSLNVVPDPAIAGRAILVASRGDRAFLAGLDWNGGTLSDPSGRSCGDESDLTIRLGPATPLTLIQSGDNDIKAGRFTGPVTIEASGSGDVAIGGTGDLTVQGSGASDIAVGTIDGTLTGSMSGSGNLAVGAGTIPALHLRSTGASDIVLGAARIEGGEITLGGSGDFTAGSVNGTFSATSLASGDIRIGVAAMQHLSLRGEGSGDLSVMSGRIDVLDAVRNGSGDLTIHAGVGSGSVAHTGTGDVEVPDGVTR